MIYELSANKNSFKTIKFKKGLNIVLADTIKNKKEDSRNGLGKTTLINIIHFCFGSTKYKEVLPISNLKDWEFTVTLDLFNEKIRATRSINNPSQIKINGNCKNFPVTPNDDYYSIDEWKKLLEVALFEYDYTEGLKYKPSFAMLSHYFIRTNNDFKSAFNNKNTSYKPIDQKICTGFLLGLDWKLTSRYKQLNDESKKLSKESSKLKDDYGSKGEIIPEINRLTKEINEMSEELENFKIHKSYDNIKKNADELTSEIHDLVNESIILEKKLQKYNESVKEEDITDDFDLSEIYEQSNFIFNEKIQVTLEQSEKFHSAIIKNRKDFLENEINSIQTRLDEIEILKNKKSDKRSEYMEILNNFGALKEYTQLQELFVEKKQTLNELKEIINKYEDITLQKRKIKNELLNLESEFQINYNENKTHLNHLINLFSENSSKLYDYPGNLIIECSEKGFDFNIKIPRLNSDGKSKMTILCYDLMLAEDSPQIDFLVHDSNIFDGVDSRQIGSSLNLIYDKKLQYICMLNSDIIPDEYINFDIDKCVVMKLSDDSAENTLLGFEF